MSRFRGVLLVVAFAPFAFLNPVPAQAFSLKEALATAYATNPQIEAARANLRATDEEVAKANAGWRPSLSLGGTAGFQHITTTQPTQSDDDRNLLNGAATLTEPLFRGGRTMAEIRRANALVRAGQAQLTNVEQAVLLDAVTAYMDVVRDMGNIEYRRNNVMVLRNQLDVSDTQLSAGAITRTDLQQTQARLASANSGLSLAEGQLVSSQARFERVIGRPPEMIEVMSLLPPLPGTLEEVVEGAAATAPALIAARETSRAADYAVDAAASSLLPQVSLQLQYQYAKNSNIIGVLSPGVTQHDASAFVQVTVPLYQGGAEYASVRQAKEQRSRALANVADADRQAREAAQSAWGKFTSTQDSISSNEKAVAANQSAVAGVIEEQRNGERSILDVLNAQEELLSGEIGLVTARHDAIVAAYELLAASGRLTARSLLLDVQLYDPLQHYNSDASAWSGPLRIPRLM